MSDQLALGEPNDPGEQRQQVGQCGRASPVSEHKDSFDIHKRIYFSGTLVANWAALGST